MRLARTAFTLVEVMITVAIIGVIASVVTLAFRVPPADTRDDAIAQALRARRVALTEGRAVTIDVLTDSGVVAVTAHPDGRIVADPLIRIGYVDIAPPASRQ
ncbi:MAG TPA: type II secretion system protein [Gemmatimonadaceae bacterium]|nr:type II secretion system protein [Gemmatimonadaceae bacterium]